MISEDDLVLPNRAATYSDFLECICRLAHLAVEEEKEHSGRVGLNEYLRKIGYFIVKLIFDSNTPNAIVQKTQNRIEAYFKKVLYIYD